jgi:hypothetical protein
MWFAAELACTFAAGIHSSLVAPDFVSGSGSLSIACLSPLTGTVSKRLAQAGITGRLLGAV